LFQRYRAGSGKIVHPQFVESGKDSVYFVNIA
jgi:hypothetical protein